jgi:uncharacterized protein (TIGR03083 family)
VSLYADPATAAAAIMHDGQRLLGAVAAARETAVPACPGWDTDALATHVARAHRWASSFLQDARTGVPCAPHAVPKLEGDRDVVDEAERWLVELESEVLLADPAAAAWTFAPEGAPLAATCAFWMRRMANETLVHRIDAEQAAGAPTEVDPAHATDVVREMFDVLLMLALARSPLTTGGRLEVTGIGSWQLGEGDLAATVTGDPVQVMLAVYGRRPWAGLDVSGDVALVEAVESHLRL